MGKKQFCFFQTAETGDRTPDSGVKGSGANHYPRAPALNVKQRLVNDTYSGTRLSKRGFSLSPLSLVHTHKPNIIETTIIKKQLQAGIYAPRNQLLNIVKHKISRALCVKHTAV